MNSNLGQYFQLLWQSVVFWSFALICYSIFRFLGLSEEQGIIITDEYKELISFSNLLTTSLAVGLAIGILYASIEFFFEKIVSKKLSLGLSLLLKNSIELVVTIIVFTITLTVVSSIYGIDIKTHRGWWLQDKTIWGILFFILLSSFVFSFIKIAIERFGSGVFFKMLIGAYKTPKEEERIFMFLDLKDSTSIAEELQHLKYSQFIQDCFFDLNAIVQKYDAEIYQYVGDEAVISWPFKKGIKDNNCIRIFFGFQEQLESRKSYYIQKYGIFPVFKAGVHGGTLIAAEVGTVKKELAYHGDVINTSARIQKECNQHKVPFLISGSLLDKLTVHKNFSTSFLGKVLLKGKQKEINIHSISNA
ncbi:adenylate cyclase [Tenacibaculum holothuriorum]|uniref:Adenylate cyclase n=1 Tax=Tenacibaculum holothuriorum TaxID=1635173 RepID=A0A1Y2PDL7_9FLAO|nr:adenylate/guanylate cyclase domain-containing protein [Tenacibaculum holothuriorum]OSY88562.1 adenylate cyclase [Tenacibaculum holothuriorum]